MVADIPFAFTQQRYASGGEYRVQKLDGKSAVLLNSLLQTRGGSHGDHQRSPRQRSCIPIEGSSLSIAMTTAICCWP